MKITCLIFSVFILVLLSIPCCADDRCGDEIMTEQSMDNHQTGNNEPCEHCSPFLSCGSCSGFINWHLIVKIQPALFFIDKKLNTFNTDWTSNFYSDIWQPPKIN